MDELTKTTDVTIEIPDSQPSASTPSKPAASPTPPPEAWDKVRALAIRQLDRFISLEPKVLRGDNPDAVHDIRVASRRLQQTVELLYPTPRPREIRRLRRQLRRSRRALSELRNCDALLQRVDKLLGRKRTARRDTWMAARQYLLEKRSESFQEVLRKLSKLNLAVFYVRLKKSLSEHEAACGAPLISGDGRTRVPAVIFHERIAQALEGSWGAFDDRTRLSLEVRTARAIHRARIATKGLRYLIEVIHQFAVPGSVEALAWLRRLQRHLGDWHDLQVLEQSLIEMIARPEFLRDHLDVAMQLEKLVLANRTSKAKLEQEFFRRVQDSEEIKGLKRWVVQLLESSSTALANT